MIDSLDDQTKGGGLRLAAEVRRRLVGLLDYVEQVVRLDERVAFQLSEYRLSDGSIFAITKSDTENLPGVRHDIRDDEGGQVWLEVERLARKEPPRPPEELAEWIILSANPEKVPEARPHRLVTVDAARRDEALAKAEVKHDDVLEAPRKRGEPENAPPRFDLKLRLEDRPEVANAINEWIAGSWTQWASEEIPRRRTIKLYQQLYKVFQLLEVGAAESSIELMWGVGLANWQKGGKLLDRPLLERRVEIELDDARGGLVRVRPTDADPLFDLKPYEELGCSGIASLSDLADIRSPSCCPSDQDRLHFAAASNGPGNTAKGRPQNKPCQKTTRTTIIGSATPIRKTNAVGMRAMVKWTV